MCWYWRSFCKISYSNLVTLELERLKSQFFFLILFLFEGPLYHKRLPFLALLMFPSPLHKLASSLCNFRCHCVFCSYAKHQNRKLLWWEGLLLEVLNPKRLFLLTAGGREKTKKGKQVKKAQKLSDAHMHLYPQINLNCRMLLISHHWIAWQLGFRISPILTLKVHFVDLTCESAAIFFEISIWVKVWNGHKILKLQAGQAHSTPASDRSLILQLHSEECINDQTLKWINQIWKWWPEGEKKMTKNTLPEFVIQYMHLCFLKV